MMPRSRVTRKYRPGLEALEPKRLLSAGPPACGFKPLVQATAPVSSQAPCQTILACGTGKGIRIITSYEV
jgi:hypothetical protein